MLPHLAITCLNGHIHSGIDLLIPQHVSTISFNFVQRPINQCRDMSPHSNKLEYLAISNDHFNFLYLPGGKCVQYQKVNEKPTFHMNDLLKQGLVVSL